MTIEYIKEGGKEYLPSIGQTLRPMKFFALAAICFAVRYAIDIGITGADGCKPPLHTQQESRIKRGMDSLKYGLKFYVRNLTCNII